MKKQLKTAVMLLCSLPMFAQNHLIVDSLPGETFREKTEFLYARLSRERMHTNVLSDKGINMIAPTGFTGAENSDTCNATKVSLLWQMLYYGRNGKSPFPMPSPDSVRSSHLLCHEDGATPILVLFADYDKFLDTLPDQDDLPED
jgi:hypothetical protein